MYPTKVYIHNCCKIYLISQEIPSGYSEHIHVKGCRDAILEGPSGYLWHVMIYGSGTSAFFKDGWEIFVSDHSIQPNDFIIFRHVNDMHFLVQICDGKWL